MTKMILLLNCSECFQNSKAWLIIYYGYKICWFLPVELDSPKKKKKDLRLSKAERFGENICAILF